MVTTLLRQSISTAVLLVSKGSERVLVLKMVLGDCLLNVLTVYAPHSGKQDEEKERFWNGVFRLVSCNICGSSVKS